ncbi:hypothetical protein G6F46_013920 [Rhizopus delemar]|nr:hypothetical protein G6F46_013920 [Rhizopus delemar]
MPDRGIRGRGGAGAARPSACGADGGAGHLPARRGARDADRAFRNRPMRGAQPSAGGPWTTRTPRRRTRRGRRRVI